MAKPLSKEENRYFKELQDKFSEKSAEYKEQRWAELVAGRREELAKELADLKGYLELVKKGEVADMEVNIRWMRRKAEILADILDPRHIKDNDRA